RARAPGNHSVYKLSHRQQRTLARSAIVTGHGLLGVTDVLLRFRPAESGSGLVFVRTDLPGRPEIAAEPGNVTSTKRRTTISANGTSVTLVEHVLAALAGLRIDN